MSGPVSLKFGGLSLETQEMGEHRRWVQLDAPRIMLNLFTEKGTMRRAELTGTQALVLIEQAAQALSRLQKLS